MAVRFDASTDGLVRTSSVLNYNAAYTVAFWVYFVTLRSDYQDVFSINDASPSNYDVMAMDPSNVFNVEATPGARVSGSAPSATTWYFGVLRRASTTSLTARLYSTAASIIQDVTTTQNVSGRAASAQMEFNGTAGEGEWSNMRVACVKMWSTNLSDAELLNELHQMLPRKTDNLVGWWPLFPGSANRDIDYSGLGRNLTEAGTLADEDGPPITWGAQSPFVIYNPASGGTTYTVSIDGTLTSSGLLQKQDSKILAGSLSTITGLLQKQTNKIVAGALTSSGALVNIKTAVLSLVGTLTSSGLLIKQTNKTLAGSIPFSGLLQKLTGKNVVGSLTSSGALANIKTAVLSLVGTLTSSGLLIKQNLKFLTGSLSTITGLLQKQTNKMLNGTLTSSGLLTKLKTAVLTISGTLTSSGGLSKQVQKLNAGIFTSIGNLAKQAQKIISGIFTSAGALIPVKSGVTTVSVGFDVIDPQSFPVQFIYIANGMIYDNHHLALYYNQNDYKILYNEPRQMTIYGEIP